MPRRASRRPTIDAWISAGGGYGQSADVMCPTPVVVGALGGVGKTSLGKPQQCAPVLVDQVDLDEARSWRDRFVPLPTEAVGEPMDRHDRPMWLDVMLELVYLAFVTDQTRVVTFEWSREASGFGGSGENHHELSHHGGDAEMFRQLVEARDLLLSLIGSKPEPPPKFYPSGVRIGYRRWRPANGSRRIAVTRRSRVRPIRGSCASAPGAGQLSVSSRRSWC